MSTPDEASPLKSDSPLGDSPEGAHNKGDRVKIKVRKRIRLSGTDPEIRHARKQREKWTHRRQAVQLRVLVVAAVVFLVMFVMALLDILTDNFSIPYAYEVLIGVASFALLIWGAFRLIERYFTARYRRVSDRKRRNDAAVSASKSQK